MPDTEPTEEETYIAPDTKLTVTATQIHLACRRWGLCMAWKVEGHDAPCICSRMEEDQ